MRATDRTLGRMPNSPRAKKNSKAAAERSTFRTEFAGYYPPTDDDLRHFVTEGLVVLDTNAVLDLYRFTDPTREEYFAALELLGERLWIPNRVGEEFHDRRASVIADRQGIRDVINDQMAKPIAELVAIAAHHAHRHGLDQKVAADVRDGVRAAVDTMIREIEGTVGITIDLDAHPDSDPILTQLGELFDGKIGAAFGDKEAAAAHKEHKIRLAGHIPPGYADVGKGERAIGDFLVWKQTINEASSRGLPVLLVTNETKPDWVFSDGHYTMPRVELVREMKKQADCEFHLVDVQTYLGLARKYLAAQVSDAAVDEAADIRRALAAVTFDHGAGLRQGVAAAGLDSISYFRQAAAAANFDPGAEVRQALAAANFDPSAYFRQAFATALFDRGASLRPALAEPGSDPAPKTLPPQKKKAAPTAKKSTTAKKPATGDKPAE